ncbi:MAG: hypothetical protein IMY80_01770 [Chloroflexi bacterium]|nr:hypothetical protein [Chloroflexota bacterium]
MTSWELQRNWEIVRYLVYYLVEDLVSPDQISGKDIVDFSSGLHDGFGAICDQRGGSAGR